jgi:hypothetical protein
MHATMSMVGMRGLVSMKLIICRDGGGPARRRASLQ